MSRRHITIQADVEIDLNDIDTDDLVAELARRKKNEVFADFHLKGIDIQNLTVEDELKLEVVCENLYKFNWDQVSKMFQS